MQRIQIIDSHTEGEPTRVVLEGGPELGAGSAASKLYLLRRDHDDFRSAIVLEPRGSEAMVGALLSPAESDSAVAQVIFFNNVGYLGMCVHGTIGVAQTLLHTGRIAAGRHELETPVGPVFFQIREDGSIEVENVFSFRYRKQVRVVTQRYGEVCGDIAYGGNWFFLVEHHDLSLVPEQIEVLTNFAWDLRLSLQNQGIHGTEGAEIDHIELFAPPSRPDADAKNFVLCPGKAYDRSPCGTGTSAKMACMAADGQLQEGQIWRQESIIGSLFEGRVRIAKGGVLPTVAGRAFVTSEATLVIDPRDPFRWGLCA